MSIGSSVQLLRECNLPDVVFYPPVNGGSKRPYIPLGSLLFSPDLRKERKKAGGI
jgi:hypothetical protein